MQRTVARVRLLQAAGPPNAIKRGAVTPACGAPPWSFVREPPKGRNLRGLPPKDVFVSKASMRARARSPPTRQRRSGGPTRARKWSNWGVNTTKNFERSDLGCRRNKKKALSSRAQGRSQGAERVFWPQTEDGRESISWHLLPTPLAEVPVKRMVFHEMHQEGLAGLDQDPRKLRHGARPMPRRPGGSWIAGGHTPLATRF